MEGLRIYNSGNPGPIVIIVASLHGEEPAGMAAYSHLKQFFETGGELLKGELRLMKGNIEARTKGIRYIKYDLNRMFKDLYPYDMDCDSYEFRRTQEIKNATLGADSILDLHSMTSEGDPFSILPESKENHPKHLINLPVHFTSSGWSGALPGTYMDWALARDIEYVAVECGLNGSKEADQVARDCAMAFLNQLGMTNFDLDFESPKRHLKLLEHVSIGDHDTYDYPNRKYESFDAIEANELIASDKDKEYRAPDLENLVIVMPASQESVRAKLNNDAFFLAQFVNAF
ncbi:MAG: putative deacylase [Oceanicoccus sp.]|jgi:predicted deacylase